MNRTKKSDELTAEMYAMYQTGVSSTLVAMRYGIRPQTVRNRFKVRGLKLRERKLVKTERERLIEFYLFLVEKTVDEYLKSKE